MASVGFRREWTIVRRVFEVWSVEIPQAFTETFVAEQHYWHAYDERRSVSLTSMTLTHKRRPVPAEAIAREFVPLLDGAPIVELPPGLRGRAVATQVAAPARASRALSGILAADGRALIVTISSDDIDWARRVWSSIRVHPSAAAVHPRGHGKRGDA